MSYGDDTPLISVCVPTYNGERFIGRAIESVLRQSMPDFELVVVDDSSSDGTWKTLEEFKDPRLRLFRNERNLGFNANWNETLSKTRGKYVKLLPQDDLIYEDCLEKQLAVFKQYGENDNLGLVACSRHIIDENDKIIFQRSFKNRSGLMSGSDAIRANIRSGTNIIGEPGAVLFRRDLAMTVNGFDPALVFCIDLDFWCRLMLISNIHVIDEPLCAFRISKQAMSSKLIGRQAGGYVDFLRVIKSSHPEVVSSADYLVGAVKAYRNEIFRTGFYLMKRWLP